MNRSRLIWTLLVLAPLAALAGVGLALRHEPRFYRQAEIEAGPKRKQLAKVASQNFTGILNQAIDPHGKQWEFKFTTDQLNSFFEEGFRDLEGKSLEKLNIYSPRVVFEDDTIRLAFRYGTGFWSTVLSYDLKAWVSAKDANTLVVEVLGRKAGAMPMPTHHILSELTDLGRRHNIDVSWFRSEENHPVAVIRFNTDRPRPLTQLRGVQVKDGEITIIGQPTQSAQQAKTGPNVAQPLPPYGD